MISKLTPVLVSFLALAISSCGSNGDSGGTGGTGGNGSGGSGGGAGSGNGGTSGGVACKGTTITANEANDYTFSSTLSFPPIKVQPKSNLSFDWSEATADLIGHSIDPKKDLNTILVFEWNLSLDDLQKKLNDDALESLDMTVKPPLTLVTDGTSTTAKLLDFGLNGSQIGADGGLVTVDQVMMYFDTTKYDPSNHTLTLMAATGKTLGQGTRMIQSFILDNNSTNTAVKMTKDSTKLTYQVNLQSLTVTGVPAGQKDITLDWGKMKTNAMGNEFDTTAITRAIVARYTQTPAELEKKFLDLELIAADLFQGEVGSGTKINFSSLTNSSGKAFSGIDSNGTWIVVLQCGACRNPAPWYLAVLKSCS